MAASKKPAPRQSARERSNKPSTGAAARRDAAKSQTFTVKVTPPGESRAHEIEINFLTLTLAERQIGKRALAQLTDPDIAEIIAVHAWVIWRRDHPDSDLGDWFEGIQFGQLVGFDEQALRRAVVETPEGYDPEL